MVNFFVKNKDWWRGRGGGGGWGRRLINFPPLKRGSLLERGGLFNLVIDYRLGPSQTDSYYLSIVLEDLTIYYQLYQFLRLS